MDLDDAARELYALAPGDFTARRTALAKQAKADGDTEVAKAVGALRRPTASAHALNLLAHAEDPGLLELLDLADDLRAAQTALDAARMSELSTQRRRLVAAVSRAAAAATTLSAAGVREVEETLAAAVASADAGAAVASGRLTRSLSYAGFGDVDLTDATATPTAPPAVRTRAPRAKKGATEDDAPSSTAPAASASPAARDRSHLRVVPDLPVEDAAARRERKAQEAREAAEATASSAKEAVDTADAALTEVRTRAAELAERVTRLQAELTAARSEAVEATRAVQKAERRHASAQVALQNARRALKKLPPPPT